MTIPDNIDCIECSAPGARWFVWRAPQGRVNVMRATRGAKAKVSGSIRPVPMSALNIVLAELGAKTVDSLKWKPASIDTPRVILARLPSRLARYLESERA